MKKVQNYMKNIGKSIKYASIDVAKDMSPTIADNIESNSELFREITDVIRDRKQVVNRTKDAIVRGNLYEAADQLKSSIFEDISTGNIYNKARKDAIDNKILGMDDFGGDDGFDFDDGDFGGDDFDGGFDDDGDFSAGDKHISETISESSQISAQAISTAVSRTAEYTVESRKRIFEFETMQNIENFKNVNINLGSINENIGRLVSFNDDIGSVHMQNSTKFFEETTNVMKESNAILKEMLEIERNRYGQESEGRESTAVSYDDVIGAGGEIDVKEYLNSINQKVNSRLSSITGMNDTFGEDSNLLLTFAASPLEFIPKMVVSNIIGKNLKGTVDKLDKSVGGFFSSIITRFNTMGRDENPILGTLGDILGLDNRLNLKTDTSKFEKGPVPWDGKARQTLIEVIPTYLAKLVALQSGSNEKLYDYETGRFIDATEIKKSKDNMIKSEVRSATYDTREEMERMIKDTFAFKDLDQKESLKSDMDEFFTHFFKTGDLFDYNRKDYDDFNLNFKDEGNYDIIKSVFKNLPPHLQMQFNRDIIDGRQSLNRRIREAEEDGDNIYRHLENNSGIRNVAHEVDPHTGALNIDKIENNSLSYLRKITHTLLEGVKVYVTNGGGRGGENDTSSINAILGRSNQLDITTKAQDEADDLRSRRRDDEERFEKSEAKRAEERGLRYIDEVGDGEGQIDALVSTRRDIYNTKKKANKKDTLAEEMLRGTGIYEKYTAVNEKIRNVFDSPMNLISDMLNKVDSRMYQVIYGNDKSGEYGGEKVNGFMDMLMVDLRSTFSSFNDWMDERILRPLEENLSGFGTRIMDGILMGLGMNMTGGELKDKASSYLFGKKDEDGNYLSKGLFSTMADQIKKDLKGVKEYLVGKNSTFKKIYTLVQSYVYDKSKWNDVDQTILLSDIADQLGKFRSRDKDEIQIAKNIEEKIADIETDDMAKTIEFIFRTLSNNGYGDKDGSILGILKSSFSKGKEAAIGTKTGIDKIFNKITKDKFSNKDNFRGDSSKLNANKFRPLMESLKKYLVETNFTSQSAMLGGIRNNIVNINAENDDEIDLKETLLGIYDKGIKSVNESNPNKMVTSLITKLKSIIPDGSIDKILNIFGNRNKEKDLGSPKEEKPIGSMFNPIADLLGANNPFKDSEKDGSHRAGLDRVPFDGYKAILHQDESVLNKKQADEYEAMINGSDKDADVNIINALRSDIDKFNPQSDVDGAAKDRIKTILDSFTGNNVDEILNSVLEESQSNRSERGVDTNNTLMGNIVKEFKGMMSGTQRMLFGTDDVERDEKEVNSKLTSAIGDIMGNVKEYLPAMGSGALLGGGVGLLGGLLGGPLAWAAIGSSIALTKNSSKVQEYLFGGTDEEGKDFKGVVPEKLMDGIAKYAPDMKKFGVTGAALGLLPFVPGGIMGGLMLGSATAFAKNNTGVQEFLFGEDGLIGENGPEKIKEVGTKMLPGALLGAVGGFATLGPLGLVGGAMVGSATSYASTTDKFKEIVFGKDDEGGLLGKGGMDKIKEVMPKAALGTLAIGALGPFGLLGSAALGTSLSMITSTDHFKDNIFGELGEDGKRSGGLLGGIKGKMGDFIDDNIKKPFNDSLAPFKQEAKLMGQTLKDSITNTVDKVFQASFGMPIREMVEDKIVKPFTSIFKKLFTGLGKMIGNVVASPFKLMKVMSDGLRDKHIRDGNDDYLDDLPPEIDKNDEKNRNMLKTLQEKAGVSINDNVSKSNSMDALRNITDQGDKPQPSAFGRMNLQLFGAQQEEAEAYKNSRTETNDPRHNDFIGPRIDIYNKQNVREKKTSGLDDDDSESAVGKDIKDILKFTTRIADEVKGQLDGVGYNVETIKNILAENLGDPEAEATGERTSRGNKKRKGIFARLLGFVSNPLKFLKGKGKELLFGKDGESGMLGWAVKAGNQVKSMIMVPFKAVGKIFEGIKKIGPMIGNTIKTIGPMIGNAIKGTMEVAGTLIRGAAEGMSDIFKGIGKGLGKASVHLIEGVGILGKEFMKLTRALPALVGGLAKFATSIGKATVKIGGMLAKGAGKVAKGIGNTAKMGIASLTKGKFKVENVMSATIEGGHLDSVGSIESVEIVKSIEELKSVLKPIDTREQDVDDIKKPIGKSRSIEEPKSDAVRGLNLPPKPFEVPPPAMPTEFGILKYKKNRSGEMVPEENKAFERLKEDNEKRDSVFDKIKDATTTNAEESKTMSEKLSIFGGEGGKGGLFGNLAKFTPMLALMIPLLPAILKMAGGLFEKFGLGNPADVLNGAINDKIGEDSNFLGKGGKTAARAVVTGSAKKIAKDTVVSKLKGTARNTGVGEAVAGKVIEKAPKVTSVFAKYLGKIFGNTKVIGAISKVMPKNGAKICNTIATKLGPEIAKKLGSSGAEGLAKQLGAKAFPVTAIAMIVYDITSGMSNAARILMVKGEVPLKVKLATGIAKAVNNFFTFGLVPLKWLVQIILKFVASEDERAAIKDSQKELKAEFQKYQDAEAKKGTDEKDMMSFDQFNKNEHKGIIGKAWSKLTGKDRGKKKSKKKKVDNTREQEDYGKGIGNKVAPFLSQKDSRWNKDSNVMKESGCGPTSAAMILGKMTGKNISPMDMLKNATGFRDPDGGTRPGFFNKVFDKFGLDSETNLLDEAYGGDPRNMAKLMRSILKGVPTAIMGKSEDGKGIFGKNSHYVVADGVNSKGNINVNDPEGSGTKSVPPGEILPYSKLAVGAHGKGSDDSDYGKGTNLPEIKSNKKEKVDYGKGNSVLDKTVILALIELMKKVVDNTDYLSAIKNLLADGLNLNIGDETIERIKPSKEGNNSVAVIAGNTETQSPLEDDNNLKELMSMLEAIATE